MKVCVYLEKKMRRRGRKKFFHSLTIIVLYYLCSNVSWRQLEEKPKKRKKSKINLCVFTQILSKKKMRIIRLWLRNWKFHSIIKLLLLLLFSSLIFPPCVSKIEDKISISLKTRSSKRHLLDYSCIKSRIRMSRYISLIKAVLLLHSVLFCSVIGETRWGALFKLIFFVWFA